MKNVLLAALFSAVTSAATWAQVPAPFADQTLVAAQAQPAAPARPAQAPAPTTPPAPPAVPAAPVPAPAPVVQTFVRQGSPAPRNIRFDISITETGGAKPGTKTVSLTVNDSGGNGSVRNIVRAPGGDSSVSLNVDVRQVQGFDGGSVRASINVEYQPYTPDASAPLTGVVASATSMFQDGRRTQILQTSDPLSDRRVTIEVMMTVLK